MSVQFAWGAEVKDVSSIWVGTSPEFEMALYTLVCAAPLATSLLLWEGCAFLALLARYAERRYIASDETLCVVLQSEVSHQHALLVIVCTGARVHKV